MDERLFCWEDILMVLLPFSDNEERREFSLVIAAKGHIAQANYHRQNGRWRSEGHVRSGLVNQNGRIREV